VLLERVLLERVLLERVLLERVLLERVLLERVLLERVLLERVLLERVLLERVLLERVLLERVLLERVLLERVLLERVLLERVLLELGWSGCCRSGCCRSGTNPREQNVRGAAGSGGQRRRASRGCRRQRIHFDSRWPGLLLRQLFKQNVFDDLHRRTHDASILLNPSDTTQLGGLFRCDLFPHLSPRISLAQFDVRRWAERIAYHKRGYQDCRGRGGGPK
jgi:hypothetical protein